MVIGKMNHASHRSLTSKQRSSRMKYSAREDEPRAQANQLVRMTALGKSA
jgi:hypothetical protein